MVAPTLQFNYMGNYHKAVIKGFCRVNMADRPMHIIVMVEPGRPADGWDREPDASRQRRHKLHQSLRFLGDMDNAIAIII